MFTLFARWPFVEPFADGVTATRIKGTFTHFRDLRRPHTSILKYIPHLQYQGQAHKPLKSPTNVSKRAHGQTLGQIATIGTNRPAIHAALPELHSMDMRDPRA